MPRTAATRPVPGPQAAYAQWTHACTNAGWRGKPLAEQVPLREGLGRVTAAPVHARWPVPRAASAAMDGIAMRAACLACPADAAGQWQLAASAFAWVDTGDPLPAGMDTVVERERVQLGADGSARITGPVPPGLHVRARGEDFPAAQLLFPAGHRLRPPDLAAAAAAGHATLAIARRPAVAIIPTGNEIRPVGSALRPGDITDSNSLLLASRAEEIGARPLVSDVQPDDRAAIAAEVRRAALAADLVLVIAGSSAGRRDHTAAVLAQAGGLAVRGVAVRPGHPVLLGHASRVRAGEPVTAVPVIGVPGYPLAAAVIFELFAAPLLRALQGRKAPGHAWQRVRLAGDWTSSPDIEDWVLVSLAPAPAGPRAGGTVVATPGRRGAGSTSQLMRADAWWPIPIGEAKFARGEYIDVRPIPGAPVTSG
jgi:molybdopterin molybdotransferase/putative molybdopterin biosynthesis protein